MKLWALVKFLPQMHRWFYLKISVLVLRNRAYIGIWCLSISFYYLRLARIYNPCRAQTFFRHQSTNFLFFLNFCERILWTLVKFLPQMHRWFYLKISVLVLRNRSYIGIWCLSISLYYVRLTRICNPCRVQTFFRHESTNFFLCNPGRVQSRGRE